MEHQKCHQDTLLMTPKKPLSSIPFFSLFLSLSLSLSSFFSLSLFFHDFERVSFFPPLTNYRLHACNFDVLFVLIPFNELLIVFSLFFLHFLSFIPVFFFLYFLRFFHPYQKFVVSCSRIKEWWGEKWRERERKRRRRKRRRKRKGRELEP